MVHSFMVPRPVVHQRWTSSGFVHACHTRSFGASNSRSIRICVSSGRVTLALCVLVIVLTFLV
jgi:hypothetical protein